MTDHNTRPTSRRCSSCGCDEFESCVGGCRLQHDGDVCSSCVALSYGTSHVDHFPADTDAEEHAKAHGAVGQLRRCFGIDRTGPVPLLRVTIQLDLAVPLAGFERPQ